MSVLTDLFTNIAASIRSVEGSTGEIPAANFPARISAFTGATTGTGKNTNRNAIIIPELAGANNYIVVFEVNNLDPNNVVVLSSLLGNNNGMFCTASGKMFQTLCAFNSATGQFNKPANYYIATGTYHFVKW